MAGSEPKKAGDVFDLNRLRDLIELMNQYELTEVDLKQEKQHIRLSKGGSMVAPVAMPTPVVPRAVPQRSDGGGVDESVTSSENIVTIDSPMVGTFYAKANPDAENFVKVGDPIGPETVVCIVEAMKVFNEIQAEVSGKVVGVLVKNEESVDFGRPLFRVDTSA